MKFTGLSIAAIAGAAVADVSTQIQFVTSTDVEATTEVQTITHCSHDACEVTPTSVAAVPSTTESIEYETKTTVITVGTEVIETVTVCPLTKTPVETAPAETAPQYETKTTVITVGTEVIETVTVCPLTETTPAAPAETTPAANATTPAVPVVPTSAPQEYETKTTFITVGTEVIETVTVCPLTSTPAAPVETAPVETSAPVVPVVSSEAPVVPAPSAPFNNQTVPLNTAGTSALPVASSAGFNATAPTTFQPSQPAAEPTAPAAESSDVAESNGAGKAAFGYSMLALAAAVALF